jgi:hypothetical protein
MNPDFFVNHGPLFAAEKLADLTTSEQWDCDAAAHIALAQVRDALEKHGELLKSDATEPQTKFFIVNPTLHALGYVYSIGEEIPIADTVRVAVDYTLFPSSERFTEVEPVRGTTSFFRSSIGLCQATHWGDSLNVSDDKEMAAQQPMVLMDVFLGSSGVSFGLVSTGQLWRLLHRATSDTYTNYLEMNLERLVTEGTFDDFKAFYVLFGVEAMKRTDEGICFLDTLLAD